MRDLPILSMILLFWFLLATFTTYIYSDPLIVSALIESNSSYIISVDTNSLQENASGTTIDMFTPTTETKTKGFLNMMFRILTFRIPIIDSIPIGFNLFVSFLNWILVLFAGLIGYRLVRHGGG